MPIPTFRLPHKIRLPGFTIIVREESDQELSVEGAWEYEPDTGTAIIRIKKSLPVRRKRYILAHELQHAIIDYTYLLGDSA